MSSTVLVPIFALVLLYLWLRGWWFAGLIVGFLYCFLDVPKSIPEGHRSYLWTLAVTFGPWLVWHAIRDHQRTETEKAMKRQAEIIGRPPASMPPELYRMSACRDD